MALTRKQRIGLNALLTATTIKAAAQSSGIGLRTIHRWLAEDKDFKAELNNSLKASNAQLFRGLPDLQNQGLKCLQDIMNSPNASDKDRIKAANLLIEFTIRMARPVGWEEESAKASAKIDELFKDLPDPYL